MKSVIQLLLMSILICTIPTAPTKAFFTGSSDQISWFNTPAQNFWSWRTISIVAGLSAAGIYGLYRWYTQKPQVAPVISAVPKAFTASFRAPNPSAQQAPLPPAPLDHGVRVQPLQQTQQPARYSFQEWTNNCRKYLPYFKNAPSNFVHKQSVTPEEFERTLDEFSIMMATKTQLQKDDAWLKGYDAAQNSFFDLSQDTPCNLYVQKNECPQGSNFIIHGDLHGDIHSLLKALEDHIEPLSAGFTLKQNRSIIFLGDYVDKGLYGCECMYTIMRLKIDNPNRVFLIRGNHETRHISSYYGFKAELQAKEFPERIINKTFRLYNLLPAALYLGSGNSFLQCCHGGIEVGFNAGPLLNAPKEQQFQWINAQSCKRQKIVHDLNIAHCCSDLIYTSPNNELSSGFMWSDFIVDPTQQTFYNPGRGLNFGRTTTQEFLRLTNNDGHKKLRGILRAHQHSPEMNPMMSLILDPHNQDPDNKGIAKLWKNAPKKGNNLWDNIVVTFNVSPGTPYGAPSGGGLVPKSLTEYTWRWIWPGFDFDTVGILNIKGSFEQWTLDIYRNKMG